MKKSSNRNIVITGASGDIAQEIIKRLPHDHVYLFSRSLPVPELPSHVDILINNAGFGIFAELSDLKNDEIDEMFKVNTIDLIKLTRDLKPKKVVNIASIAGKLPTAKSTVYAASKAAVIVFSDALRQEGAEVLTVNTGPVKTKFHSENATYLKKVGQHAVTADFVAKKIVKNLSSRKRELNLPVSISVAAKLRALFPNLFDYFSLHFFNYK
ncbi:MAG: SDR family NAD(P)-dependent oxidoreductase [Streptococcaceae bacterium]|jgi:short-subunit dehydrogenase|nr:SDR family NAD(P)-dependent oxidoreductase [Streptococcaceae bacterium]